MKRTFHLTSPSVTRPISLALCYSLIITTVFLPSSASVSAKSGSSTFAGPGHFTGSGFAMAPARLFASLLMFFQGGGGLPSVPGPNLPDLEAARQVEAADPTAPSEPGEFEMTLPQICDDCEPNTRPVAVIGGPYSGVATEPISFHGSDSFDPDGNSITFQWNFGDGGSASVSNPSHVYASAGSYTVTLVVTDDLNLASSPATTSVNVSATPVSTPTPTPTVTPTPTPGTNNAIFVSQSVPSTMSATNTYAVSVTMRNTGSTTWSAAHLYRLASQSQGSDSVWGMSRVHISSDVLPGAEATFSFSVIAPPGSPPRRGGGGTHYAFQWRMIQEGVESFGKASPATDVVSFGNMLPIQVYTPQNHYSARLEPRNRTGSDGADLLSRNFNWSSDILGLAGRAGLNLNLGLSYNSLVWTRVGSAMIFDADRGFPSAGFRIGFSTIQAKFYNNQANTYSYLMITPSGGHLELRQTPAAGVFESVGSSHLQLIEGEQNGLLLIDRSGTQMTYLLINGEFRCTSIKDSNGNFITIKYEPLNGVPSPGLVTSIVDTLQRTINFNYDAKLHLRDITQTRNGEVHTFAIFVYDSRNLQTNFAEPSGTGSTTVLGLPLDNTVAVLTQIGLDNGSRYKFDYNSWGQVNKVTHFAADSATDDSHPLSYVSYNLPLDNTASQTDCPRFTERRDWVENWNGSSEAVTSYAYNENAIGANGTLWEALEWAEVEFPDHTKYREYATAYYDDWQRGLTTKTEIYSADN
jgi:PKD repeat protein